MNDPNRTLKWFLVIVLVSISLVLLYPPSRKLKGGIDLVGGTSLLFEIDTTGLRDDQTRELSTRIMNVLKQRVDPQGQLNLEWRPVGNTRLEIRMPRPPKVAIERRDAKEAAIDRLDSMNISRVAVEQALNETDPQKRSAAIAALQRKVPERAALLEAVDTAYAAKKTASQGDSSAAKLSTGAYEKAMSDLVATSLPTSRLLDILGLPKGEKRIQEFENLRKQYPSYDAAGTANGNEGALTAALKAHDEWAADKTDLEDPSDLKRRIRGAGVLEFRILADRDPGSPGKLDHPTNAALKQDIAPYENQLAGNGPRPKAGDRYRWFLVENIQNFLGVDDPAKLEEAIKFPGRVIVKEYAGRYYVLAHNDSESGLLRTSSQRKWTLQRALATQDPMSGKNVVSFQLDGRGGALFRQLTAANVNRQLCIMLDDSAMSHARINEAIGERGQISGDFTMEKVKDLVRTLEAGSLPARLKETPLSEKTIGPSLGQTNKEKGLRAAVWSSIGVVVFVFFYYGFAGGGVANLALILNLLFTLAIMALMQATFTLPGIAGMILTLGMAIDANVLIFERFREERARGLVFKKALNAGYDKAFSAILDGNLTTLITCIILGFVGSEEIKGFAITLGIGLVTSMFTALTVTRLIFNTLAAKGWLNDFSMRKLIGIPNIDWVGLRRRFWLLSGVLVSLSLILFITLSVRDKERVYDIEFLGGTSVQIDLKKEFKMTDEQVTEAITSTTAGSRSAVQWLAGAADQLAAAKPADGETPGQFVLRSTQLTGEQLATLLRSALEPMLERNGARWSANQATFELKSGGSLEKFTAAIAQTTEDVRRAAERLTRVRIQSVGEVGDDASEGLSYEIVTTETNRGVVQAALLAALGDKLKVQRAIAYTAAVDEDLTREPFFVIEGEDHYLSDVLKTTAINDIRAFRGGVAIDVTLLPTEEPLVANDPKVEGDFMGRLREIGLQPEFDQFRTREVTILPLDQSFPLADGRTGYRRFAIVSVDDSLHYDEDSEKWKETVARTQLAQVDAALGRERSLSKVVQFQPQVAAQMSNQAVFGLILAFIAIAVYVWLRFGTQDYGLAVLVALVHDVAITVGALALANLISGTPITQALQIEDFKVDLPFIAAILTIIGYSLNDTIVVFDRIRENKGRSGTLSASMINTSINQTLSRTILTSLTVFITVLVLYLFGGGGIHGFAFALLVGVISGTYSTVAIAVPLVYRPVVLRSICWVICGLGFVGIVFAAFDSSVARAVLSALGLGATAYGVYRVSQRGGYGAAAAA